MIELHYWPTPNGKKVTILLEELGLPYKITPVNIQQGAQFSAEFLQMNPNHRMPVIFRVRRGFDELWLKENKRLPVQVTSAVTLDSATVDQIGARIAEQTGQKIDITSTVEPDILGGLVIRVGNSILDASIRNRLEQLRKQVARA